ACAVGHRARGRLDVDAVRDAAAAGRPALDPALSVRGRGNRSRIGVDQVLAHHAADGDALHHPRAAIPHHRELQDVRPGEQPHQRRAGLGDGGRIDLAGARGVREMTHRIRIGLRDHPVRVDLPAVARGRALPRQGEAAMKTIPHSPLEPSARSKWVAGTLVIAYAVISLIPLVWIFMTSFRTPEDAIAYPPKVLAQPSLIGYVNLF